MGYSKNFKAVNRKLANNIVISSGPFLRFNKFNFGARMALFNYDDQIVVWSAIPYSNDVIKALNLLTGKEVDNTSDGESTFNIKYLVVPDKEHTLAVSSFKKIYPNAKVISMETADLGGVKIDHCITSKYGNKLINKEVLQEIGIKDSVILDNFEFVYLPYHSNKELVMYDVNSKILFEADLLFNLGVPGTTDRTVKLEQYSAETGYPDFGPHQRWSFLTRYLQPYSKVGNFLINKIANPRKSQDGLKAIYGWDFNKIVMCHGNVIDENAKEAFKNVFRGALKE